MTPHAWKVAGYFTSPAVQVHLLPLGCDNTLKEVEWNLLDLSEGTGIPGTCAEGSLVGFLALKEQVSSSLPVPFVQEFLRHTCPFHPDHVVTCHSEHLGLLVPSVGGWAHAGRAHTGLTLLLPSCQHPDFWNAHCAGVGRELDHLRDISKNQVATLA